MTNKVVLRFKDGSSSKGATGDFFPNKIDFHLTEQDGPVSRIIMEDLKAVFFVRDFIGDKKRKDTYEDHIPGAGRKVQVKFYDNEKVVGFCQGYSSSRQGFFITPADKSGNNERIYVINSATKEVKFI